MSIVGGSGNDEITLNGITLKSGRISINGGSGNDEIIIESDNVEVMSGSGDKITVASGVTANIKLNNSSTVKATGSNGGAKFSINKIGSTADVFIIEDGFNGTLKQLASEYTEESDEVNISLTKGISFTLNGTAYQYSDDGTLTYTADGVTRKFLGTDNLEGVITPKTIATTGNWENYIKITDTIDLTTNTALNETFYGTANSYSEQNYFAKLTIDGDKYTLTQNSGVGNISGLKIILGADKTLDAKFAAQVTTSGNVTVNGVAYSSTNELTIATNETNSTLYSGTITITTSREGVTLSGDSNGVTITATNGAITSITGLDAGGTVTYDGKNYARTTNNFIVDGTNYYGVDDNTNVLALSTSSLFKINGIKSSENITITSTKVTIPQSALDGTNVTITSTNNYTLELGSDVVTPETQSPTWTLNGTTAI